MLKHLLLLLGGLFIMTTVTTTAEAADPENILLVELSTGGTVIIEMKPDLAPKHVERIKTLARQGFYDGIVFHRVIPDFMAQTGDPTGTGMGGSELPDLEAEFNDYHHGRGAVSMARTNDPNSANSQFFICFKDCGFLNNQYTVWGQVVEGMDYVDAIAPGEPPAEPDKIVSMKIQADVVGAASAAEAMPAAGAEAEAAPAMEEAPAEEDVHMDAEPAKDAAAE